jgi:hypothetical protein
MTAEPTGSKTADPPAIADNDNGRANVLADRQIDVSVLSDMRDQDHRKSGLSSK